MRDVFLNASVKVRYIVNRADRTHALSFEIIDTRAHDIRHEPSFGGTLTTQGILFIPVDLLTALSLGFTEEMLGINKTQQAILDLIRSN